MNREIAVRKEGKVLSSLAAALWFLSIAIMAMRIAEVFGASGLNPTASATSIGAQRFGEQSGIFLGPVIGGLLIPVRDYQEAIVAYGVIMILGSVVSLFGVAEPKPLKVL